MPYSDVAAAAPLLGDERRQGREHRRLEQPRPEPGEQRQRDRRLDAADECDADERDRTHQIGGDAHARRDQRSPARRQNAEDRRRQEVGQEHEGDAPRAG